MYMYTDFSERVPDRKKLLKKNLSLDFIHLGIILQQGCRASFPSLHV